MIGGNRVDWFKDTLLKRSFMGGIERAGVAAQCSMVELWNPAASGKRLICHYVGANLSGASVIVLTCHNAALANDGDEGNKCLGEAVPVGLVKHSTNATIAGTYMARLYRQTNPDIIPIIQDKPIIIGEGLGLIVSSVAVNVSLRVWFEWVEVPV